MALARPSLPLLPPTRALGSGRWVKLIAGASNQDLVAIEDLAAIYALAGVHCVDVAADGAVVAAARRGIAWARQRHGEATDGALNWQEPWLMVSLSDGEDPHFRKAWFDPLRCPPPAPGPVNASVPPGPFLRRRGPPPVRWASWKSAATAAAAVCRPAPWG